MSVCVPGAGIKAQVCSLVELLVTTLYQAYAVFYVAPEGSPRLGDGWLSSGLLFTTLENVTSTTPTGTLPIIPCKKWLKKKKYLFIYLTFI
jgi:hypothetical protein